MQHMKHIKKYGKYITGVLSLLGVAVIAFALMGASADGSGVTNQKYWTVMSGATGYTAGVNTTAYDVGLFGAVESHIVMSIVPETGTVTVTAQWSDQGTPCGSVTNWTANEYVYNT